MSGVPAAPEKLARHMTTETPATRNDPTPDQQRIVLWGAGRLVVIAGTMFSVGVAVAVAAF
jgi:hypothetical protein